MTRIAVVTGATGCVGRNLVDQLLLEGWDIVCLHRQGSDISKLDGCNVELKELDLCNRKELMEAIPYKADALFHCAGNVDHSNNSERKNKQSRDNVDLTRALIYVAEEKEVGRFIFTSTGATWGHQGADRQLTSKCKQHYVKTKRYAEIWLEESSLDFVIIHPIIVIGKYDYNNYSTLFSLARKGLMKKIFPGRIVFCDAEDVARAHTRAFWSGKSGEHYILHGHYTSWFSLFKKVAPGIKGVYKKWQLYLAALVPYNDLTVGLVRLLTDAPDISQNEKRKNEDHLSWKPRPIEETIKAVISWDKKI